MGRLNRSVALLARNRLRAMDRRGVSRQDDVVKQSTAFRLAAVLGFLAVSLGAFGALALENTLEVNDRVDVWETAVLYHFVHTLVMLWLAGRPVFHRGPFLAFLGGVVIFSGSLYALAVTNVGVLGAITPLGGLSFLVGWVWLAIVGFREEAK